MWYFDSDFPGRLISFSRRSFDFRPETKIMTTMLAAFHCRQKMRKMEKYHSIQDIDSL
jgi:hypothetical protein